MTVRIVLVDDHPVMRDGLRAVLETHSDFEIVGEAGNGLEAIEQVRRLAPDVVVMDIGMPDLNGVEATRRIQALDPGVKVLALSTYDDQQFVLEMLEAGASGYVLKANVTGELLQAIEAVSRNKSYLSPDVAATVVDNYVGRLFSTNNSPRTELGGREREVLQLLAEGKTSKQIAKHMQISTNTVEAHRRNIMKKLNLHSIAELTKYAVRHGLTSP